MKMYVLNKMARFKLSYYPLQFRPLIISVDHSYLGSD